ncbi:related to GYP1-GTPase activating protein [Ustilago bromivora]|uniref:Related to GYP1-GTPase activating protein n=1 Tax=Ustilago bromivora TaxID=307758 RepID=A0A1K0GEC8_9BASI|nr:related to GYP1-GTPase activating protein [Ustilago bromivora]
MSNPDYSLYEYFVETIEDLIPRFPDMVQGRFRRLINNKTYGTPNALKGGQLLEFAVNSDKNQIITPLSIMIECVGMLYYATHELGPFRNRLDLGRQMRAHVNFFIANKDSDTTQILDLMIEGPMDLEAELDVASSEGGNAMQDSTTDEASSVAQMLTTTSKLSVAPTPTAREFTFDPIAAAGDGLVITGYSHTSNNGLT